MAIVSFPAHACCSLFCARWNSARPRHFVSVPPFAPLADSFAIGTRCDRDVAAQSGASKTIGCGCVAGRALVTPRTEWKLAAFSSPQPRLSLREQRALFGDDKIQQLTGSATA
ncbi:hypothetical protein N656DRAFT_783680 [Canariomyces notabilis]|uniref:Uncharacterized protein n=1 Tax=Canariomyces notabilis TaxID=2074819 RepID=A0AAN6QHR6_9PEZI|nr:hypothetical protein N656DRAFT_783680 [Canariomyces arenarius]